MAPASEANFQVLGLSQPVSKAMVPRMAIRGLTLTLSSKKIMPLQRALGKHAVSAFDVIGHGVQRITAGAAVSEVPQMNEHVVTRFSADNNAVESMPTTPSTVSGEIPMASPVGLSGKPGLLM